MIVYKKVRILKDGNLYPLFIDKKRKFRFGEWMHCEYHPTKGFAPRSIDEKNPQGGWHCCFKPVAPHLADELKSGERRVWMMCESKGKSRVYNKPDNQGGAWILVEELKPIRIIGDEEIAGIIASVA